MIQELINTEINIKAKVTDDEIENRYRVNTDSYVETAKINASHILVDSKVVAIKILYDLKHGADFGQLASNYSLDLPTKDNEGNIGYYVKGSLLPEFEEACDQLEIGEISDIVQTDIGYHIIKIIDKQEEKIKTLDEAKREIEDELYLDKQVELYDRLLQELRTKDEVYINKESLNKIDLSNVAPSN